MTDTLKTNWTYFNDRIYYMYSKNINPGPTEPRYALPLQTV